jgi:hypothetical protein
MFEKHQTKKKKKKKKGEECEVNKVQREKKEDNVERF